MKFGFRTPSPKRSLRAATTGRAVRAAKSAVNPIYGKKGVGFALDPERAVYNAVYNRVTIDARRLVLGNRRVSLDTLIKPSSPAGKKTEPLRDEGVGRIEDLYETVETSYRVVKGAANVIETSDGKYYRLLWSLKGLWKPSDQAFAKRMATLFKALGYRDVALTPGDNEGFVLSMDSESCPVTAYIVPSSTTRIGVADMRVVRKLCAGSDAECLWVVSRGSNEHLYTKGALDFAEQEQVALIDIEIIEDLIAHEAIQAGRIISLEEKNELVEKYASNSF